MGSLNKVMIIGYIGKDFDKKVTENDISIASFPVATSERWKDKEGNKREKTEWHNIVCFNRVADVVSEYCSKGSQILVEGSLQTVKWTDKENNERYTTQIKAANIQFLDNKASSGQAPSSEQNEEIIEDDMPF